MEENHIEQMLNMSYNRNIYNQLMNTNPRKFHK
jgi:hypothetical protein